MSPIRNLQFEAESTANANRPDAPDDKAVSLP
jgi:hypothetical protein